MWNVTESLCSLSFAARCRKVALGRAGKNVDAAALDRARASVARLGAEVQSLRSAARREGRVTPPNELEGR